MQNQSNKLLYAVIAFFVVVLIIGFFFVSSKPKDQGRGKVDSQPEAMYSGWEQLTDRGVTSYQLNDAKYVVNKFVDDNHIAAKSIKVKDGSVNVIPHSRDSLDQTDIYKFVLNIDNKDYRVTMSCLDPSTIRFVLYDGGSGSQLYDSKNIDVRPAE